MFETIFCFSIRRGIFIVLGRLCFSKLNPQIVGHELVLVFGQEHLVLNIDCLFFIAALMFSIDEVKCLYCCLYL